MKRNGGNDKYFDPLKCFEEGFRPYAANDCFALNERDEHANNMIYEGCDDLDMMCVPSIKTNGHQQLSGLPNPISNAKINRLICNDRITPSF